MQHRQYQQEYHDLGDEIVETLILVLFLQRSVLNLVNGEDSVAYGEEDEHEHGEFVLGEEL